MEEVKTYAEKLQDPRWQQKRLRIMERDDFTCQKCFGTENMLTVHHKYYIYKKDPWDYPDDLLITLCDDCHKAEEEAKYIISDFAKVLLAKGYMATELVQLLELLQRLPEGAMGMQYLDSAAKQFDEDMEYFFGKSHV
jgi:hypothetical protein